ncbi:MAG: hypothetical protein CMM58_10205 [Rhodospirillaceae bacterium]|nr:hypothetical protein [Rhodospirillaceae bacterium]|tara:strand:+ start:2124 stop:3635 length:1512 start_codon:yes stop_codon:yes gene_type:complete
MTHNLDEIMGETRLLIEEGKLERAKSILMRERENLPNDPLLNLQLGRIFVQQNRTEESLHFLWSAYNIAPNMPSGVAILALALQKTGKAFHAQKILRQALVNDPSDIVLLTRYASLLQFQQNFQRSITFNERILVIFPMSLLAHANIAEAFAELEDYDQSLKNIEEALSRADVPQVRLNKAINLFLMERYSDGWSEYEARLDPSIPEAPKRLLRVPRWNWETLKNKTILVCSEQGVGDEIYFSAYIPKIKKLAQNVIMETDPRLVNLFKRSFDGVNVHAYSRRIIDGRPIFSYGWLKKMKKPDFYIDLASLPHFLSDTHVHPLNNGYHLKHDCKDGLFWREEIERLSVGKPVIGLFWRSGLFTPERQHFYPSIRFWGPILTMPNVCFLSLQYDDHADDIKLAQELFDASFIKIQSADLRNDLDQLAAICSGLAGVISPSTTTAHLAAAVGTKTIIIDKTKTWSPIVNNFDAILPSIEHIYPPTGAGWNWVFEQTRGKVERWLD